MLREQLSRTYRLHQQNGAVLNMARGNPSKKQLDLSMGMLTILDEMTDFVSEGAVDCRNYGAVDGILEAKRLMAGLMQTGPEQVLIHGNSSLAIMYDSIARSVTHGVMGNTPWNHLERVKFLCPVPGYDRHFAITAHFGIEMIPVPMQETGPDMDLIERLVSEDEAIKGIWCVPQYSNPTGTVYSNETIQRFAGLKPKADDFRIYWDNAYGVHHLYAGPENVLEILDACAKVNNPDMVYKFASTSKISFPGAGIAAIAASAANLAQIKKQLQIQTIGYDKLNQLRHVKFFGNADGIRAHMKLHAKILRPKFEKVLAILESELGGLDIGEWTNPKGGYFISFNSEAGCAKKILQKAKKAGLIMTEAGATFPYGMDPEDKNIRIAPTYLELEELTRATELFCLCVKIVSIEKLLGISTIECRKLTES